MKLILDTNAYTALRRGDGRVVRVVREAQRILFSTIVCGELLYGFKHGTRFLENWDTLQDFLAAPDVQLLPVTLSTAFKFGTLRAALRTKGKAVPSNDVWIAAQVLESGAELLTLDAHFQQIEGLPLISVS